MKHLLFIAMGGSIGSVSRYLILRYFQSLNSVSYIPLGTLTVNIIGGFLIGLLYSLFNYYSVSSELKVFLTIGILGAFTTFSTFSLETVVLFKQNGIAAAILNVTLNNIICFLMVIAGSFTLNLFLKTKGA
ncbi:MAG: fluoride efflux transporter CrcB [Candidatus Delongbacteria bacterium]|nr:fluoride efflux transporter CrcB [Candidatus Delongbacteria bacterium]